jgi:Carboxypeptidase regulatory-like domain
MRHARQWQLVVLTVLVLSVGSGAPTRGQVGTSSVSGEVRDQQAAAIPGATVTLLHTATGAERVVTTDRTGTYRFLALQPGTYQLKVELQGFAPVSRDRVVAAVDTATRLEPIVLAVGGLSEVVEVQASAAVGTVDAALGNVIENRQILALPLAPTNSRANPAARVRRPS